MRGSGLVWLGFFGWTKSVESDIWTLRFHDIMNWFFFPFSYARRRYPSTQSMASERRCLPLLRGMSSHYNLTYTWNTFSSVFKGQCWRHRQSQGRNEGFCHHRPCRKRMRAFVHSTDLTAPHTWPIFHFNKQADLWPRIASNAGTVV